MFDYKAHRRFEKARKSGKIYSRYNEESYMKREQKQEASMSVQSRISAATLAELDAYWISESKHIKSMSQLVSWSLDLLTEILWANQKLRRRIESIAEARNYLLERELCQPSLYERGFDKMGTAVKFEGMREEGIDPSKAVRSGKFIDNQTTLRQYHMLHNENSVSPFTGRVDSDIVKQGVEIMNKLPETDHSLIDELGGNITKMRTESVLVEGTSAEELAQRITADDKAQEEALKKLDINELMKSAVKGD